MSSQCFLWIAWSNFKGELYTLTTKKVKYTVVLIVLVLWYLLHGYFYIHVLQYRNSLERFDTLHFLPFIFVSLLSFLYISPFLFSLSLSHNSSLPLYNSFLLLTLNHRLRCWVSMPLLASQKTASLLKRKREEKKEGNPPQLSTL